MEPGSDYDVWIAKNVMGWKVLTPAQTDTIEDVSDRVCCLQPHPGLGLMRYFDGPHMWELRRWHPSTDIVAAWDVVEHFNKPEQTELAIAFRTRFNQSEVNACSTAEAAHRICEAARFVVDPPNLVEAFNELRREFGHHFDGLDVDAFMREMRDDEIDDTVLRPCPFCGQSGELAHWSNDTETRYFGRCEPCDIVGPWALTTEEAIERWNKRAPIVSQADIIQQRWEQQGREHDEHKQRIRKALEE